MKKIFTFLAIVLLIFPLLGWGQEGESLNQQLIRHEGYHKHPYRCSAGYLHIGIGRNLEGKGLSEKEVNFLLINDIRDCYNDLSKIFGKDFLDEINHERLKALMDLRFQLGPGGFRSFQKMIGAVKKKNWEKGSKELLSSQYARNQTERAKELAEMLD